VRVGLMGESGRKASGPPRLLWHVGDALGTLFSILAHHGRLNLKEAELLSSL